MSHLERLKIVGIASIMFLAGCGMQPNLDTVSNYVEIDSLLTTQFDLLYKKSLVKEVWLDGQSESQELAMDSLDWRTELSFLKEINPNQPEYVGGFAGDDSDDLTTLALKSSESGALKKFSFASKNGKINSIQAIIHEDKDVYVHHRDINLKLENSEIVEYQIDGYQKIMLKDTIWFRIQGSVVN
ncbi:MAG: hypothetical protein ABJP45_13630 [Cyclobacteriaceae bacterium]